MKVLVLSISDASGHRAAADAVVAEWLRQEPQVHIRNENFFHFLPRAFVRSVDGLYYAALKRKPLWWQKARENNSLLSRCSRLVNLFYDLSSWRLRRSLLNHFIPDVVVCTQAYPCNVMARLKKMYNYRLVAVITDYHLNTYWWNEDVDDYILPSKELADVLARQGAKASALHVWGIPLRRAFTTCASAAKQNEPTILVMGGSLGLGAIEDVAACLATHTAWKVIVITGRDEALRRKLQQVYFSYAHMTIVGYCSDIPELMAKAHVLISKPGGVTMAEALAVGLPVISVAPLAGQEQRNEEFLEAKGLLHRAPDMATLTKLLEVHGPVWCRGVRHVSEWGYPWAAEKTVAYLKSR